MIYKTRKKGILKLLNPSRKSLNELGCLKECLIVGTKSWMYFETLFERAL